MDFIFDPSLALYLPLYELDGASFASRDAYGHLCTVTGAIWRPNGHYFDGTDDRISAGNPASLNFGTGSFGLGVWFKADSSIATPRFISKRNASDEGFEFFLDANGRLRIILEDAAGNNDSGIVTSANVKDDKWHFGAVSVDRGAGATKFSVDGVYKGTGDISVVTGTISNSINFWIGSDEIPTAGQLLKGLLGELWSFNRALGLLEWQEIYLATKWRYR